MDPRAAITALLRQAGVKVGGEAPHDIKVNDERFYSRLLSEGSLGLGESYMDGWWDARRLDEFFARTLRAGLDRCRETRARQIWPALRARVFNMQSRRRSRRVAQRHYNLGNEFYRDMLDPQMFYTCGYWERAQTLEHAQEDKCELVCRKLQLKSTDRVLDLGCGWGGFALYAAERYGCHVTAYNIASEQIRYARERAANLPVEFVQADYRDARGSYDKIVSIGMFEHIGPKNYERAMHVVAKLLSEDGLFLMHCIGRDDPKIFLDPWTDRYIFPGGVVPAMSQLLQAIEGRFVVEHFHNFGQYYDRTLMAWHRNFLANWHRHQGAYGERFYRMWSYYLLSCAGSFRARRTHLWQWVFSRRGVEGGYHFPAVTLR